MKLITDKSKVSKGGGPTTSAKVTIPMTVRKVMDINPGDELLWSVEVIEGKKQLTVEKIENKKE